MDADQIAGKAKDLGGKVQERVGQMRGDAETQAKGLYHQAEGAAQEMYGQAKETVETAMDRAVTLEEAFRNSIDKRPYLVVFGALTIGWLIGRSRML